MEMEKVALEANCGIQGFRCPFLREGLGFQCVECRVQGFTGLIRGLGFRGVCMFGLRGFTFPMSFLRKGLNWAGV